jgi:heme oxygenase
MHDPELSVRSHLRARTAQVHARLDDLAVFQPILSGHAGWPDYVRLLGAYHGFYTAAWHTLHAGYRELAPLGVGPPARDPLATLSGDLLALGTKPPASTPALATASPAQAVGWVWVVEGSSLGAVVIDRALTSLFGAAREGRRFFEPLSTSALRWRAVCGSMENYGRNTLALPDMVEGAQEAFACMERCLTLADTTPRPE